MRIGICDDVPSERAQLRALLCTEAPTAEMVEYTSGEALLMGLATGDALDLLFLDICMDGINGIETAGKIRKTDSTLPIIFLTTSPEFAVASYRVQAQDYLLKPVSQAQLAESLTRQFFALAQRQASIPFQSEQGVVQVPVAEIVCLEVVARRLTLMRQDGTKLQSYSTIQSMETLLCKYPQFVRPHRSYLVNLHQVKQMSKDGFLTVTGALVPIARGNMPAMKSLYMNKILEK